MLFKSTEIVNSVFEWIVFSFFLSELILNKIIITIIIIIIIVIIIIIIIEKRHSIFFLVEYVALKIKFLDR